VAKIQKIIHIFPLFIQKNTIPLSFTPILVHFATQSASKQYDQNGDTSSLPEVSQRIEVILISLCKKVLPFKKNQIYLVFCSVIRSFAAGINKKRYQLCAQ
jgi:hypothetical protein